MLRHLQRGRDQAFLIVDETIDETELVEPLRGKAEAECHLHRDRIGQIGKVPVIVSAEQPTLGL